MTHTPGPWKMFIDDSGTGKWTGWPLCVNAGGDCSKTVVRTGGYWPYEWDEDISQREAIDNANLIAAAPDLYLSVVQLIGAMVRYGMDVDGPAPQRHRDMMETALAAIAKAEGRS